MASQIDVQEMEARRKNGALLLDVRTSAEFWEVHVEGAVNVPLADLSTEKVATLRRATEPVFVLCKGGVRAAQAAETLARGGMENVFSIKGGTTACCDLGVSVVRGEKSAMSMERQVRIAAGSLVLCGVIGGMTLHPTFYFLSALVGAGLVFSGIADWCGMALLLTRLPWNRK